MVMLIGNPVYCCGFALSGPIAVEMPKFIILTKPFS